MSVTPSSSLSKLWEEVGHIVSDCVFAGGLLIARITGGSVYYYHQDHLGNTRLVTLGSTTSFSSGYEPYRVQYRASGTDPVYKYTGRPQRGHNNHVTNEGLKACAANLWSGLQHPNCKAYTLMAWEEENEKY